MFSLNFSLNFVLMSSLFLIKVSHQETVLAKYVKVELNSGDLMPLIGLGTSRLNEQELVRNSLDFALASGYRLIDSATVYRNEELIGKALKELLPKYNLTRKDVFITTKLAPYDQGETAYMALERSLKNLNTDYVDLYLIHSPRVVGVNLSDSQISQRRDQSWQQLVRAKKNGLTKNIGVSNYDIEHLSELLKNDHGVKPAVNQVLLRWAFQENIAVIPKARSKEHLEQNIDLNFIIPEADMKILNSISRIPLP